MQGHIVSKVKDWINSQGILTTSEQILCAVSGGKDSICMCLILKELNFKFSIAHVNFQLRDKESDDDEDFVRDFAEKYQIPFHSIKYKTKELIEVGESIQLTARRLRYQWFYELAESYGYEKICTAHSANDNAETLVYNMAKGTGLKGLVGIPAQNGKVVRPILCATSQEIENFLKINNAPFRTDSSNALNKYARNKIRHHVIPILEEINPDLIRTLTLHSQRFTQIEGTYRELINAKQTAYFKWNINNYWQIDLEKLMQEKFHLNLLKEWFLPFNFSEKAIENILEAATGATIVSHNYEIHKDRQFLLFAKIQETDRKQITIDVSKNGKCALPFGILTWELSKNPDLSELKNKNFAFIDAEKVASNLQIKPIENGTYFQPFGLKGKQLMSDYFINLKKNKLDKNAARMLCNGNLPIWLINERIDENYKIDTKTEMFLVFKWTKNQQNPFPYNLIV